MQYTCDTWLEIYRNIYVIRARNINNMQYKICVYYVIQNAYVICDAEISVE